MLSERILKMKRNCTAPGNLSVEHMPVTTYYLDAYVKHINDIPVLREAYAFYSLFEKAESFLTEGELIAGRLKIKEPVFFNYGCGTYINENIAEEHLKTLNENDKKRFEDKINLVRKHKYNAGNLTILNEEEAASERAGIAHNTFFGGHMVMDYSEILKHGLAYYTKFAEEKYNSFTDKNSRDFEKAMILISRAIRNFIRNIAEQISEPNMKKDFLHIADNPPNSFRQAIQLVWLIHTLSNNDSQGRFDQYLYPFYKADIKNGRLTDNEAYDFICAYIIKMEQDGSIQNMTVGGTTPDGSPAYNEITKMVLHATSDLGFSSPNLCLRVRDDMPEDIWQLTHNVLSSGQGLPALYNDKILINCFLSAGYPIEDAADYCLAGCSQSIIPGRSNFMNDIGIINIAKIISVTLNNGFEPYRNIKTGLKTGKPDSFKTFEAFYDAFVKQLIHYCEIEAAAINKDTVYRASCEGYALRCLLTRDCIERGKGIFDGGPVYNNIQLECIGITNAADSLAAIKQIVYEEKKLTLSEFNDILNKNWEDNEVLRQYIINKVPKFGNDDAYADEIRHDISKVIFDTLRNQKSAVGGVFVPGEVIFVAHDYEGNNTGALPDGRLAGTVLADSAGASQGRDKKGPTALMNSVYKIPTDGLITSIVLNMKFIKNLWCENPEKYIELLKAFFNNGGQQIQLNVCDNKVLKDALDNPELYPNLIVRVGGYSAYFNSLSKALKQEIIERNSHL